MANFGIICAAPRSGTTFLADAVCKAYAATNANEIFNDAYVEPGFDFRNAEDPQDRANFFMFRADAILRRPELLYPDINARRALFDLYLDHLRETFTTDRCLIDIKYNSWHHLDDYWRFQHEPPGLIKLVREKNIPIVHLVRENLFALYCSLQLARLSNIWHSQVEGPAATKTLKVDVENCRHWMTEMAEMQSQFSEWFHGHPVHTLTYESLLDQGHFAKDVSDVFTHVFGSPPIHELTTTYRKVLPPLYRVVENAPEVIDRFAGTPFERFVKTSLDGNADEPASSAGSSRSYGWTRSCGWKGQLEEARRQQVALRQELEEAGRRESELAREKASLAKELEQSRIYAAAVSMEKESVENDLRQSRLLIEDRERILSCLRARNWVRLGMRFGAVKQSDFHGSPAETDYVPSGAVRIPDGESI